MTLFIASTPIGNLQDITLRAAKTLLNSKFIIAESSSKAGTLLDFLEKQFGQKRIAHQKIASMTEDEEEQKIPSIIRLLEQNDGVLISEAGTPLISDPGFKLVREVIKRGINVVSIPGPTAAIAGLVASGLPSDKFIFLGYLSKKKGKRQKVLEDLKKTRTMLHATAIIFESPHRLLDELILVREVFGNVDIVIARELTKIHEQIVRGKIDEVMEGLTQIPPKGEFVILL